MPILKTPSAPNIMLFIEKTLLEIKHFSAPAHDSDAPGHGHHHRFLINNSILVICVMHYPDHANFEYDECREVSIEPSNDRYDDQNGTDT